MTQPYYPQQQPMQQPAMPQYPVQPQQQYMQQPMPQYPMQQQGYAQPPMFQQPPPAPLVQGTLSDFLNQPSTGGGPVFSWKGKPIGTTYGGIVSRQITNADVQQQTQPGSNIPAYYRDGRPKYLMKVPLTVQPTQEFPDGQAQWWVSGSARDELARAMAEVGCESNGVPEQGAAIVITLTGERPSGPGMNPSKTYRIQYRRPPGAPQPTVNGAASVQPQQPQPGPLANTPAQVMQQMQPVMQAAVQPQATVSVPAQQAQAMHQQMPVPQAPPVAQPVQQPAQTQQVASDLTPDQQQLLASLTVG